MSGLSYVQFTAPDPTRWSSRVESASMVWTGQLLWTCSAFQRQSASVWIQFCIQWSTSWLKGEYLCARQKQWVWSVVYTSYVVIVQTSPDPSRLSPIQLTRQMQRDSTGFLVRLVGRCEFGIRLYLHVSFSLTGTIRLTAVHAVPNNYRTKE